MGGEAAPNSGHDFSERGEATRGTTRESMAAGSGGPPNRSGLD